jgi:hypothetical protein
MSFMPTFSPVTGTQANVSIHFRYFVWLPTAILASGGFAIAEPAPRPPLSILGPDRWLRSDTPELLALQAGLGSFGTASGG